MSVEKRSALMSRIRGRDTGPEKAVAAAMRRLDWEWEGHCRDLPGRPDFVFRTLRIAIFVDGDFWHGRLFSKWRHKLSEKWELKIEGNRERDQKNHRRLRRMGWRVIRLWECDVESDLERCMARVHAARLDRALPTGTGSASTGPCSS